MLTDGTEELPDIGMPQQQPRPESCWFCIVFFSFLVTQRALHIMEPQEIQELYISIAYRFWAGRRRVERFDPLSSRQGLDERPETPGNERSQPRK